MNPIDNSFLNHPLDLASLGSAAAAKSAAKPGNALSANIALSDTPEATAGEVLSKFGQALQGEMDKINGLQAEADDAVQQYATGGDIDLHNVIMAVGKVDTSLQLAAQIRNRAVAAYQEINRMPI
ncbi:MAG: flagellar hook-basal body complex protein FliE [Candidatus Melainabacteria bacterium]|nr:flagellar hook-basal body complex protein FliE [Candidatus Melainabacteria bacterium]